MDALLKAALNEQANHEFFAAQSYEAMAVWCAEYDYHGFARYFQKQANEERAHARRFLGHLDDRSIRAELSGMEAPRGAFENLVDIALHAQKLELANSEKIYNCYRIAVDSGYLPSLPFLLGFIEEQTEEESWTNTMVQLTKRAECPGSALDLDRHIEKILSAATATPAEA
jgi:ferritin